MTSLAEINPVTKEDVAAFYKKATRISKGNLNEALAICLRISRMAIKAIDKETAVPFVNRCIDATDAFIAGADNAQECCDAASEMMTDYQFCVSSKRGWYFPAHLASVAWCISRGEDERAAKCIRATLDYSLEAAFLLPGLQREIFEAL